jgi:hypothetical protein
MDERRGEAIETMEGALQGLMVDEEYTTRLHLARIRDPDLPTIIRALGKTTPFPVFGRGSRWNLARTYYAGRGNAHSERGPSPHAATDRRLEELLLVRSLDHTIIANVHLLLEDDQPPCTDVAPSRCDRYGRRAIPNRLVLLQHPSTAST